MLTGYRLPESTRKYFNILQGGMALFALIYLSELLFSTPLQSYIDRHWDELEPASQQIIATSSFKTALLHVIAFIELASPLLILAGVSIFLRTLSKVSPLSVNSTNAVYLLGILVLIYGLIDFIGYTLMLGTMTFDAPPGHRYFFFYLQMQHVSYFIIGVVFLLLGSIIRAATTISNEHRQIV